MTNLKQLIESGETHMVPGAFNALSARLAERAGFKALYVSGAGTANGWAGLPDIELMSATEVIASAGYVARSVSVPVIADSDTGFGGPLTVSRTVREFERASVSAIHIEDQDSPKRCGHLAEKRIVDVDQMAAKVRAAVRSRSTSDFLVIARTDSRAVEGLSGAIERAQAYVEAGADIIFPEALQSEDEFRNFAAAIDAPLLANMTEFGRTPMLTREEFENMGYALIIYPLTAFRVMLHTVRSVYEQLIQEETQRNMLDTMLTRPELYDLVDYPQYEDLEREFYGEIQDASVRPWSDIPNKRP